jgi:hypothetical protein
MDWNWIWQNLASAFLWELVLIIGGGALLGYIRAKWPHVASPVMFGVVAAACLGVLSFVFTGHSVLSKEAPQTTPQNVEENVKAWADHWGLAMQTQPQPTNPPSRFTLLIRLPNDDPVVISQLTANNRYLQIQGTISSGLDLLALSKNLSKDQHIRVQFELMQELALARTVYRLNMAGDDITGVTLTETVPITPRLTEDEFVLLLDEMGSDLNLTRATMALALHSLPPETKLVRR